MINKHILLIVLSHFLISAFAQTKWNITDDLNIKKEILVLDRKIGDMTMKDSNLSKLSGLRLFHVFWLEYNEELIKEDFIDHSFLTKLKPTFFTQRLLFRWKKYLVAETLISDLSGRLVARSDGRVIYSAMEFPIDNVELLCMLYKKEIDFVFYINLTSLDTLFAIKGKDIYVLRTSSQGLKIYPLEEFVNCCWDKFVMHHDDTGLYVP